MLTSCRPPASAVSAIAPTITYVTNGCPCPYSRTHPIKLEVFTFRLKSDLGGCYGGTNTFPRMAQRFSATIPWPVRRTNPRNRMFQSHRSPVSPELPGWDRVRAGPAPRTGNPFADPAGNGRDRPWGCRERSARPRTQPGVGGTHAGTRVSFMRSSNSVFGRRTAHRSNPTFQTHRRAI